MTSVFSNFRIKLYNFGPVALLYFFSISELDTEFSNLFEILSFNLQIIVIYYWQLKEPSVLGNGNIFIAGICNDVITSLPLGLSAISYLSVSFVASYIKHVTVNISLFTDWFTFVIAIFFSNLVFLILVYNFTDFMFSYSNIFYNAFFTFIFFPFFWFVFHVYKKFMTIKKDD